MTNWQKVKSEAVQREDNLDSIIKMLLILNQYLFVLVK